MMEGQLTIEKIKQAKEILDNAECNSTMMATICSYCHDGYIYEFHIFDENTGDFDLHWHIYDCPVCRGWSLLIQEILENAQNKRSENRPGNQRAVD